VKSLCADLFHEVADEACRLFRTVWGMSLDALQGKQFSKTGEKRPFVEFSVFDGKSLHMIFNVGHQDRGFPKVTPRNVPKGYTGRIDFSSSSMKGKFSGMPPMVIMATTASGGIPSLLRVSSRGVLAFRLTGEVVRWTLRGQQTG